jgi:uncharacterized protein YbaR (Trm112 family)
MSEPLLCPKCKEDKLHWIDPDMEDLLESGIMKCHTCKAEYKGIPGWMEANGVDMEDYLKKYK